MKKVFGILILLVVFSGYKVHAQDTIVMQTFTFGSPQDAWFEFPSDTVQFEKILMLYTLKCNSAQSPACGEWDYLTYTYLYDYTGETDSSEIIQPWWKLNGTATDSVLYSTSPTYTYTGQYFYHTVYDDTTTLNTYTIDVATSNESNPLGTSQPVSRSFYLWRASELSTSGMSNGDISGLRLNLNTIGSDIKNLKIRMMLTSQETLCEDSLDFNAFSDVYFNNLTPISGWNSFAFLNPFSWDGTSNIIVEISYENQSIGIDNLLTSNNAGYTAALTKSGNDRCVEFSGSKYLSVPINDSLLSIDSLLSVSFWQYGSPDAQPQNGTSFRGNTVDGYRVFNAHVPWSNLGVYWDCGNDGSSYDRINKTATTEETEGEWHYWAFTKNVMTGNMKIYLDGNLWHSGTGLTNDLDEVAVYYLGGGGPGSTAFEGRIDEFAMFKAELSQNEIQNYMKKKIDASHPQYNKLITYFPFNDDNMINVGDSAPCAIGPANLININNPLKHPSDYIFGFTAGSIRPDIIFEQGIFNSHMDSIFILDSIQNAPWQIVYYLDSINNPGQPTDTITVWPAAYYNYLFDAGGNLYDSVWVSEDTTIYQYYYSYYNYFPEVNRYELARYITPYGNGLSLSNGWTWTFDVTDYRPLLSDSVRLVAGNWQELLDMKFLMIKGTPPRDIISIQNLWNGGFNFGDATNPIDTYLPSIKTKIPANAQTARWKSRITGHGMDSPQNCAEFCAKTHYYLIDSIQRFSKLVWRDNCDLNPLYPQGGTWVYDRANWCPGAEVWTYDFEITPFITPGDTVELDHDVQSYVHTSGWDYFQIEDQLITYGAPNFTLDAAIYNVLSPSNDDMWSRKNPICAKPEIIIRNNGSTTLTSLDIDYGIQGATSSTYQWTGSLEFMETETVYLDTFAWAQGADKFVFDISNPNGGTDEYATNNTWVSNFDYVPVMPNKFIIEFKTNNYAYQNGWTLKDDMDNTIFQRTSGLTANTYYRDTMELTTGCYEFKLTDSGEDGLTWWANSAQGNGYLRIKNETGTAYLKVFDSDFGGEIYFQFTVGLTNDIDEMSFTNEAELYAYPNPANDYVQIDFNLPHAEKGIIEIRDLFGRTLKTSKFEKSLAGSKKISLEGISAGTYLVHLKSETYCGTKILVVQ